MVVVADEEGRSAEEVDVVELDELMVVVECGGF